ncbi:Receptor-like protein 12 [Vitis vinifera]|uniref:Receptor-like protein 12 n=1 Tax=Vitis vinifera TaxID=29760 RepID=A0A438G6K2_VITVI|nr:Receptor-like protein 12 [Vitis vinifera]
MGRLVYWIAVNAHCSLLCKTKDPGCETLITPICFLIIHRKLWAQLRVSSCPCAFSFYFSSFYPTVAYPSSFMQQPLCQDSESSALLQFKQSFLIDGMPLVILLLIQKLQCGNPMEKEKEVIAAPGCNTLFSLVHLRRLDLSDNHFNYSEVPFGVGQLLRLRSLNLSDSAFAGQIPSELLALSNLVFLDLSANPMLQLQKPSLRNLVQNLAHLKKLHLSELPSLKILSVSYNPDLIGYLPEFQETNNQLSGQIPSWLMNLTQLTVLDLGTNNLEGGIPSSLFELVNLQSLSVGGNSLNGTVELNMLLKLKNLTSFQLSGNSLSLLGYTRTNVTLPKFKLLGLDSCNLTEFPDFLRNQDELVVLSLANNKIHGLIPKLSILMLDSNMLQGPLPIPPPSTIEYYSVSRNKLIGEISPLICNMSSLMILDLSSNNLSGRIPQCLANLSKSLSVLDLGSNSLDGPIPQTCTVTNNLRPFHSYKFLFEIQQIPWCNRELALEFQVSQLRIVDLSDNKFIGTPRVWRPRVYMDWPLLVLIDNDNKGNNFKGQIPTSTGNLKGLHLLNLGDNNLTGHIPSSLGNLPRLESLDPFPEPALRRDPFATNKDNIPCILQCVS